MRAYWRRYRESIPAIIICTVLLTTSMLLFPMGSTGADYESTTLRIGVLSDTPDFNMFNLASNSIWKHTILDWPFESIAMVDYDSRPIPYLAEGWDFDHITLTVNVYLREGVLFHDGEEMHADDVHFSYLMARDGTTYSYNIIPAFDADHDGVVSETELNNGVQIISDYQVRMVMAQPYGQFFANTLTVPIMPKHIWEDHVDYANRVDVTWGTDPDATIGTGPFFYAAGSSNDFRILDKFTEYWGQDHLTPCGYRTYPPNVGRLHFVVKSDIDSAISALGSGELDHIASHIPVDRLPLIDSDPGIAVNYLLEPGYYYLAFNEKKEPMNNISFRKAVSHLIDKAQVVDEYMGGFGAKGTAAVSPYFGAWFNPAVTNYMFDLGEAIALLDAAGYIDVDSDGWRNLPDGTPMEKLTILAPPADYDSVRIQTAEMIASNLVEAGIDAEALEVDFDTLVARLCSFDYQMLVMGWALVGYTECVSVLYDIYGASSPVNSWAFWSDANPNPYYYDLGGVNTLADERTMELVDEFSALEDAARSTFDVMEQIDYVKQGQEIIADAVPCNILYYRVNVMATSTAWTGWMPYMGTLLNMFSLSELVGGSADASDPTVTITAPLEDDLVDTSDVEVFYTADGTGSLIASVEVNVDGFGWEAAGASPITVGPLTDGEHTVEIRVTDEADNQASAIVNFTVDTMPPTVSITAPEEDAVVGSSSVVVTWTATDAVTTERSVDGGGWVTVTGTSATVSSLADGEHTVSVRVTDGAGHTATDSVGFMVDTTPPTVSITAPTNGSSLNASSVTVTWTSSDSAGSGIDTTEVKLDTGAWATVFGSSREFTSLVEGTHLVSVRVTDNAGNDATATVTFMVDTVGPSLSITSPEAAEETENKSVTVTWTCTDTGCGIDRIEVRIDGGDYVSVGTASEHTFSDLVAGEHTVDVRAYDKAGNMVETSVVFTISEGGGMSALLIGGIVLAVIALAAAAVAALTIMRRRARP